MWIMTTRGFFSVVHASDGELMVRARARKDLNLLAAELESMPMRPRAKVRIIDTPEADYPCRLFVAREAFAAFMATEVLKIGYTNFKNEVAKTDPERSHGPYLDVWHALNVGLDDRRRPGSNRVRRRHG